MASTSCSMNSTVSVCDECYKEPFMTSEPKCLLSSHCFKFKMSLRNSASAISELTSSDDIVYDDTHTQGQSDDRVRVLCHVRVCRLNNNTINMPCNDIIQYTDVVDSVT